MGRILAAVLAGTLLAACGGTAPAGPGPEPATVTGTVRISPCRPVERPNDPPCQPAPGVGILFTPAGGGASVKVASDAGGSYSVRLSPGAYEVRADPALVRTPQTFTVAAGQLLRLDLTFDVGIR